MPFDDPNSFLWGLNQFATPSSHNSPLPSASHNTNANNNGSTGDVAGQRRASALLNGMDAFAPGEQHTDALEAGSFADQLELWTNANFSFDGPTGHALLGDEDKDKDGDDKKDEDKDEEKRAGKRARNDGLGAGGPGRRGKGRQRDEEDELEADVPTKATNQGHKEQPVFQDQQNFFAPPLNKAEEARRPGYDQAAAPADRARSRSQTDNRAGLDVRSPGQTFANFAQPNVHLGQFQGQPPAAAFAGSAPNGVPTSQAPGQPPNGQLDLTSLLALQQLVSQNPLALASLVGFAGLNSQLGVLGAQVGNLGALNGQNLQQLQQQMQQQQQQQEQPQNGSYGVPNSPIVAAQHQQFAQFNPGYPSAWPGFSQFSQPPHGSASITTPAPASASLMNGNSHRDSNAGITTAGPPADEERGQRDRKKRLATAATDNPAQNGSSFQRERRMSSSDGNVSSESGGTHQRSSERSKMLEERAAERDDIPPLKLIDTGNPEADAEANRLAIEEDKRKRNTAASARFRVKKKQREAALEAHSKELSAQLAEVKEEMKKLRNENQWLKGLIQVRPGGKDTTTPNGSAPEALQAAQQLQALHNAVTQQQHKHLDRARDTGIRPRGVGTEDLAGQKRDREA